MTGLRTPDEVSRTASGGGASIEDKFSERKNLTQKQNQNRDSAVLLCVIGSPLKLDLILS